MRLYELSDEAGEVIACETSLDAVLDVAHEYLGSSTDQVITTNPPQHAATTGERQMASHTKIDRRALIAALPASYDPSSVRIHADGRVSARVDCNVIPGAQNIPRLYVGTVATILREAEPSLTTEHLRAKRAGLMG